VSALFVRLPRRRLRIGSSCRRRARRSAADHCCRRYCQLKSGETLGRPYAELLDRADRARWSWNGSFWHFST